jgi:hypothetical protein
MESDFEPFIFGGDEASPRNQDHRSKTVDAENLKYLSKFQNPHLNQLLSALTGDGPLQNPVRVKSRLMQDVEEKAARNREHPSSDHSTSLTTTSISKTPIHKSESSDSNNPHRSYKRNIRCATVEGASAHPEPSPPLSSVLELFSPSLFESDSPDAKRHRVFTFDATHIHESSTSSAQPLSPPAHSSAHGKLSHNSPDISNRPPPISTAQSPQSALRFTRRHGHPSVPAHPSSTSSAEAHSMGVSTPSVYSPRLPGRTPRSPFHRAMDDKDFAELYDVAKDAGFFADTPRNVDRASPHPFAEYSHSHRSSEDDTSASRSGQEDRGSTHHDRGDHLSHASDTHSAHIYPFARPTHSEEESPSSDRGHNNEDETEEFVHVAIPSITELDKALTSTTGYSHSQRTCVIPSPPKGATKKKKKVIVRNPLDEMGVAKVVDASGVIVTQQALGSSSSTHTKQAQGMGSGGDVAPVVPTVLPSIPDFLRRSVPAVLPASFAPPPDTAREWQPGLVEHASASASSASTAAVPSSSSSMHKMHRGSNSVGEGGGGVGGVSEGGGGENESSQLTLSSLCVLLINDCQKKEHIRDAKRYGQEQSDMKSIDHNGYNLYFLMVVCSRDMKSLSDAPSAVTEDIIWIDPVEIEKVHGVKLRYLQNLMNILEAVGLVS